MTRMHEERPILRKPEVTVEDIQVLLGSPCLGPACYEYQWRDYHIVKFVRRRLASTQHTGTSTTLGKTWPSTVPQSEQLVEKNLCNPWTRHHQATAHEMVLVTDASLEGWAGSMHTDSSRARLQRMRVVKNLRAHAQLTSTAPTNERRQRAARARTVAERSSNECASSKGLVCTHSSRAGSNK